MLVLVADPEIPRLAPVESDPVGSFQYEGDPDIPAGVTIIEYRRARATPCRASRSACREIVRKARLFEPSWRHLGAVSGS